MSKIKFTKGELKKQRDDLRRFERFLPILQLKKQQIQLETQRSRERLRQKIEEIDNLESEIGEWARLLNEPIAGLGEWVRPREVRISALNIAGVDIPVFEKALFGEVEYDLFAAPLWADKAVDSIRRFAVLLEEEKVLKNQIKFLSEELRIVNQRVNLFEKVKIPECRENARRIRIYLGDQGANAVGRSKIAKTKLEKMSLEGVLA
ncbi:MAG: V-type ATP synthase subunit D [Candidatus Omnitrophota bacterium]